jgi:hypothetical protein
MPAPATQQRSTAAGVRGSDLARPSHRVGLFRDAVGSAGLVLAVFEAASTDAELADLARQMTVQRATTAGWIVDEVRRRAPLRVGSTRSAAIDTVWVLMDPAVFDRLTRRRGWAVRRYQRWFANSVAQLLTADAAPLS